MHTNRNIPYYVIASGLFILLKFAFTLASNDDLAFLLKPTNQLVGLLTGTPSFYTVESGYYHKGLNVIIDKSCSGFNFWMLCFLVFTYVITRHCNQLLHKILSIPTALVGAYLLTIFANTSRIFVSVVVQNQTKAILSHQQHVVHEAIGIITNLSFLVVVYFFTEKLLTHRRHHADLA